MMQVGQEPYPAVAVLDSGSALRVITGSAGSEQGALVVLRHNDRTVRVRHVPQGWDVDELWAEEDLSRYRETRPRGHAVPATIAICTLGVHPRLSQAVLAALAQDYPGARVVVVDNDPSSGAVREALGDLADAVKIVDEPRRGLSHARNAAIAEVASGVLAFTDDDAVAEASWLARLMEPFRLHESLAAVTGLVVPAELRTPAQRAFEAYVGFGKGLEQSYWTLEPQQIEGLPGVPGQRGVLFPFTTGKVGSGNNMAFRVEALREMGGFDVALGAGSIAQGGEDLDIFTRTLLAGKIIAYTPDAVVWHYHRESMDDLYQQIRANGIGMGALIAKAVVRRPGVLVTMAGRSLAVAHRALTTRGKSREWGTEALARKTRRTLLMAEIGGLVRGPGKYFHSMARHN